MKKLFLNISHFISVFVVLRVLMDIELSPVMQAILMATAIFVINAAYNKMGMNEPIVRDRTVR